jgi:hypothetical protein
MCFVTGRYKEFRSNILPPFSGQTTEVAHSSKSLEKTYQSTPSRNLQHHSKTFITLKVSDLQISKYLDNLDGSSCKVA